MPRENQATVEKPKKAKRSAEAPAPDASKAPGAAPPAPGNGQDAGADPHGHLRVDEDILKRIEKVVSKRERVVHLMDNSEGRKDQVKREIYDRVTKDYQRQLDELDEELAPLTGELSASLAEVHSHEKGLREEIGQVNDRIEEMRFRCEVEEFSQEDLFPVEEENARVLKQLTARLAVVDEVYARCERLLSPADFARATGRGTPEPAPESPAEPIAAPPPDLLDEPPTGAIPTPTALAAAEPEAEVVSDGPFLESETAPPEADLPARPRVTGGASPDSTVAMGSIHAFITEETSGVRQLVPPDGQAFVIGRHPECDLVLDDRGVSRRHVKIERDASSASYVIHDLANSNPVLVNGDPVKGSTILSNGDRIALGRSQLTFVEEIDAG